MRPHTRRREVLRGTNRRVILLASVCSILVIILYSYAGSRLAISNDAKNRPQNEENDIVNTYDMQKYGSEEADPKIKILFWEESAVHWLGKHILVSTNYDIIYSSNNFF